MRQSLYFLTLVLTAPALLAEDDATVAHVVDSISDRMPVQTVAPKYPRKARRDRVEGQVEVCFEIDRKGRPRRIALKDDEELQSIKSCRRFIFSLEPVEEQVSLVYGPRYAERDH
jgi:hypothetical protein